MSLKILLKISDFTLNKRFLISTARNLYSNKISYNDKLVRSYVDNLVTSFREDAANTTKEFPEYGYEQLQCISLKYNYMNLKKNEITLLESSIKSDQNDKELLCLLNDEIQSLGKEIEFVKEEILSLLYPKDKKANDEVILEVNAGVGGQEAMLFTNEMFTMYSNYVDFKNWQMNIIKLDQSDLGGIRHATMSLSGMNAFNRLKFEGGVHRVQRTPSTEKSGRLHTSTTTVAIFRQPSEVEVTLNPKDLKIETCKSSGKGGQHVNTTDSAVRIVHMPTGISAECQNERSQTKNKEMAMRLLRTKIFEKQNANIRDDIGNKRKVQVGTANRNEKIRTYNFKDDRITDHRIKFNVFGIQTFFEGTTKLDELIDNLIFVSKEECLIEKMKYYFNKNNL